MKKLAPFSIILILVLAQLACALPINLPFGLGGAQQAPTLTPQPPATRAALPTQARTVTFSPSGAATVMPLTTPVRSITPPAEGRLSDPDGFYSLVPPQGWKVTPGRNGHQVCVDAPGSACLTIALHDFALYPEYILEKVLYMLEATQQEYVEVSRSDTTLGAYDGLVSKVRYRRNGVTVQGEVRVVTRNRVGYEIIAWYPLEKSEPVQALIIAAVKSFVINEPKASPLYDGWGETLSENLVFYTLPGSYAAQNVKSIAAAYERAYQAIRKALELDYFEPVDFYLYPSLDALYRSTYRKGAFAIEDASEVHALWVSGSEHSSLGREVTQVMARNTLGYPWQEMMGVGLAACLDQDGVNYRALGKGLLNSGKYIPLNKMMGNDWFALDLAVATPQAGAFVCYLLEQHGAMAVWDFYVNEDLDETARDLLGMDLAALEKGFKAWLGK